MAIAASIASDLGVAVHPRRSSRVSARTATQAFTASTARGLLSTPARTVSVLAATFLAGGAAGVMVRARSAQMAPTAAPSRPVATLILPAPSALAPLPSEIAPPSTSTTSTPPPPRNDAHSRDIALAAERVLIEQARMAVARGQGEAALDAVGHHAREFPRGRLREEREALAVQALALAGRADEDSRTRRTLSYRLPRERVSSRGRRGRRTSVTELRRFP